MINSTGKTWRVLLGLHKRFCCAWVARFGVPFFFIMEQYYTP